MLSYQVYKVIHLLGVLTLMVSLGGMVIRQLDGVAVAEAASRRWTAIGHGVALFLVLLGGMGMLARLQLTGAWPGWVWLKIGIWVSLGAWAVVIKRSLLPQRVLFLLTPAIGALAAFTAIYKPL